VAHRRDVVPGASDDQRVEVTSGLAVGDRIVVDGASALDDGMAVREGAPR
jgi:multidrug efflux pump subunit AcrA (membrane-fusion protein)